MARELTQAAQVAKLVRQWLKAEGIAGSVTSKTYSMGDNVNVRLVDQVPAVYQKVKEYCAQYEYDNVNRDIPQTKYLFVNNDMSDELKQKVWEFAKGYYNFLDNLPVDVKQIYNIWVNELNNWAGAIPRNLFSGGFNNNAYWDAQAAAEVVQ